MLAEPGTDLYEVQKEYGELGAAVGAFGKLLMDPTEGDTSIHPTVRALFVGHVDAMAGIIRHLGSDMIGTNTEKALFESVAQADGDSGQGHA